jgi:hypothetical protein
MIGYYDSDLPKIDGVWKLTRLDVKHSLRVFRASGCLPVAPPRRVLLLPHPETARMLSKGDGLSRDRELQG